MKPVDQSIFEDHRGNCFAACVASILELPVADVPNFREQDDMIAAAREWLAGRGYSLLPLHFPTARELARTFFDFAGHCIVGGKGPRLDAEGKPKRHAVVCHTNGYGVRMVHDPHPSRAGVVDDESDWRWVWFIVKGNLSS